MGGGGIYIEKGTVNFTAGTIEENIIHEVENNCGAGVFIGEKGTFNMSGGTIKDCTTQEAVPPVSALTKVSRGVGVYVAGDSDPTKGTFKMTGGTIENCKPRSGHTADGGGVGVGGKALFTMGGSAVATPSTGNTKGDNDVYLLGFAKITVNGSLTCDTPVARITVPNSQYQTGQQVLNGSASAVSSEHTKFTVTPQTVSGTTKEWGIDSYGKLKEAKTIDGGDSAAWKKLKNAVQSAANGDVITIKGTVKATNASGNSGEIVIDGKNITIKGAEGATTAELDANSNYYSPPPGAPTTPHRIFKVTNGTLMLKNLTLKNGNAGKYDPSGDALDSSGGGILLESDSVSLSGVIISGCKAITTGPRWGQGGGIYIKSGTLTMGNSELSTNEATKAGGGVYIASNGIFNLIGGQLSSNVISNDPKQGIAVYNDNGTFKWTGGTITNHHAGSDDTVIAGPYTNTSGNTAD